MNYCEKSKANSAVANIEFLAVRIFLTKGNVNPDDITTHLSQYEPENNGQSCFARDKNF